MSLDETVFSPGVLVSGKAKTSAVVDSIVLQSGLPLLLHKKKPLAFVSTASRTVNMAAKRAMDVLLSAAALFLLMPLFLIVAIWIKLESSGPVIFRQDRIGLRGEAFKIYKFRSMRASETDGTGVKQTTVSDARVTRVGKVIRKLSIDELPQLVNVLQGTMSLVGPRPHVPGQLAGGRPYQEVVPYYMDRYAMKPGLTGFAQANGLRGSTADVLLARSRVDHDLAYIQNFTILLDLKIILMTVKSEFITGSGY
jgi:lipopolysaccharide/colanic/teichoic acid biosynthesis glycosyltransferase